MSDTWVNHNGETYVRADDLISHFGLLAVEQETQGDDYAAALFRAVAVAIGNVSLDLDLKEMEKR